MLNFFLFFFERGFYEIDERAYAIRPYGVFTKKELLITFLQI